jgi:hypothetical protein
MVNEDIIGTWRLVEHSQIDEEMNGLLIYHPNGSMSVLITGKKNKVEVLIAYSGFYTVHENQVNHEVLVSDKPARLDTSLKRYMKLENRKLILTESLESELKVVWERLS